MRFKYYLLLELIPSILFFSCTHFGDSMKKQELKEQVRTTENLSNNNSGVSLSNNKVEIKKIKLFIVGDSTAANGTPDAVGWGKKIIQYFDPDKITIVNNARGGRSSKTFILEGLWEKTISEVYPGDYVLVQFGHNDSDSVFKGKARGSLPGTGLEYEDGLLDDGTSQRARTFGYYIDRMVHEVMIRGATPILLSLTIRNIWKDGQIEEGNVLYNNWIKEIAVKRGVAFIDLSLMIRKVYQELGYEKVSKLFPKDYVHTGDEGADINASLVISGLKALEGNIFENYLSDKGKNVVPTDSSLVINAQISKLRPLPEPQYPELPNLIIVGDSTVRNDWGVGQNGQWGWGDIITQYFDEKKINIVNRALGGTSSRTYITLGYWEKTLDLLKKGDFLIIQFGHNDSGPINDNSRARGTLKGNGEEMEEIDNLLTKQKEIVHTYGWYLRKYIKDAKAKGCIPIVCSPVPRARFNNGKITSSEYAQWAQEAANQEKVPFINLNNIIGNLYNKLGENRVLSEFFPQKETTHTNLNGATLNAECVIYGIKTLSLSNLEKFLKNKDLELLRNYK
ncbi:rhamnogalacturonan acetylesterase [Treponema sp. J25]|uniref:rhamnogalacturonan acetylesterase n=1 Tax=Treponema sp. J25 TaxID=2094121 RepID=UPI001046522A|nr:rhamnogalacturonan acetylesterase [Treponema sp. J25]TCW61826.1 GDSL family lipase [Treponema sp. J25]